MWLATDNLTFVEVYCGDYPYSSFSGPINLATEHGWRRHQCGRCTTEQHDWRVLVELSQRSGSASEFTWTAPIRRCGSPTKRRPRRVPPESAHGRRPLNLAVSADGLLPVCQSRTRIEHRSANLPSLRHPQSGGPWYVGRIYRVGQRHAAIVVLNEDIQKIRVFLSASGGIFMCQSTRWPSISVVPAHLSGTLNIPPVRRYLGGSPRRACLEWQDPWRADHDRSRSGRLLENRRRDGHQLKDSSGWGNTANITGSPSWVPVLNGLAMTFNGSTHGVGSDQANLNATTALSLAAWIKPNQLATQDVISRATFGSADGYALSLGSNGKAFVHIRRRLATPSARIISSYPPPETPGCMSPRCTTAPRCACTSTVSKRDSCRGLRRSRQARSVSASAGKARIALFPRYGRRPRL